MVFIGPYPGAQPYTKNLTIATDVGDVPVVFHGRKGKGHLTDAERDALRAKIVADGTRLHDSLAPFYLGKECPLNEFKECRGTRCVLFLLQQNDVGKIAGAACCIPLIASQVGPIADGLMQIAQVSAGNAPKILAPPPGLLK